MSRFFLHDDDIIPQRLQEALDLCGPIPRTCLEAAQSDAQLDIARKQIQYAIQEVTDVATTLMRVYGSDDQLLPHLLFKIYPASDSRAWECCMVAAVSDRVFNMLASEVEIRARRAITSPTRTTQSSTGMGMDTRILDWPRDLNMVAGMI
jgi:hypothetical protein